jgi:hypothetical protein
MSLALLDVFEGIVGVGVIVGIAFLLYSGDFVVIHRRFLGLIAIGSGITTATRLVFMYYSPAGIHWSVAILFAHLLFILFIVAGLYSLISMYPSRENRRGSTLLPR